MYLRCASDAIRATKDGSNSGLRGFSTGANHSISASAAFQLALLRDPILNVEGLASAYRCGGLRAPREHLALQLEHSQVDVSGRRGAVDVPHHLQSL